MAPNGLSVSLANQGQFTNRQIQKQFSGFRCCNDPQNLHEIENPLKLNTNFSLPKELQKHKDNSRSSSRSVTRSNNMRMGASDRSNSDISPSGGLGLLKNTFSSPLLPDSRNQLGLHMGRTNNNY